MLSASREPEGGGRKGNQPTRNTKGGGGPGKRGALLTRPAAERPGLPWPPLQIFPQCLCLRPVPGTAGSGLEVRLRLSQPSPAPRKPARSVPRATAAAFSSVDRGWGPQQGPRGLAEPGPASLAHNDCPARLVRKDWPRGGPSLHGHQPESWGLFRAPSAERGSLIQPNLPQPALIWFRGSPSSLFSPETPCATGQEPWGLSRRPGAGRQSCGMKKARGSAQRGFEDKDGSPAASGWQGS